MKLTTAVKNAIQQSLLSVNNFGKHWQLVHLYRAYFICYNFCKTCLMRGYEMRKQHVIYLMIEQPASPLHWRNYPIDCITTRSQLISNARQCSLQSQYRFPNPIPVIVCTIYVVLSQRIERRSRRKLISVPGAPSMRPSLSGALEGCSSLCLMFSLTV